MSGPGAVPTAADVLTWPVTVDVPTAGRCFGLGRDVSYELARTGGFPTPRPPARPLSAGHPECSLVGVGGV
jgi:hypothetical protein